MKKQEVIFNRVLDAIIYFLGIPLVGYHAKSGKKGANHEREKREAGKGDKDLEGF